MTNTRNLAMARKILHCTVGSKLHGLNLEGQDDTDEMGITIPPIEYVLGLNQFEQYTYRTKPEGVRSDPGDLDLTIYSLKKWISLAVKGNPTILLPLFAPEDQLIYCNDLGKILREHVEYIVSKQAGPRFLGYLEAQQQRVLGKRGQAQLPNRPELIAQYGYDTKYAMHMCRLAMQGIQLMEDGHLTLPMRELSREILMDIRRGKWTQQDCLFYVEHLENQLKAAIDKSTLPEHPDINMVNDLLCSLHLRSWREHDECKTDTSPIGKLRG